MINLKNNLVSGSILPFGMISLFVFGVAFAPLLPIAPFVLGCLGVGSILTTGEWIVSHFYRTPLDKFFEEAGVQVNGNLPQVVNREYMENGWEYKVKMPAGSSIENFEKLSPAIEQYTGTSISMRYDRIEKLLIINTCIEGLKEMYRYEFTPTEKPLEVFIGYDLNGKVFLDIEKAPHVLCGGGTNSGKSNLLRCITTYLCQKQEYLEKIKNKESELDIYLVDFQGIELPMFSKSKYIARTCKGPNEFGRLLNELHRECNRRLEEFEKYEVINIQGYNRKVRKEKMKYKVIIIDEFATLTEFPSVQESVKQLLERTRKVGYHVLIFTQQPTVECVSSRTKANCPVRIALKCSSQSDSRVILDCNGAEELRIGGGHALLKESSIKEFQILYIDEEEAKEIVKPTFINKKILSQPKNKAGVVKQINSNNRPKKIYG